MAQPIPFVDGDTGWVGVNHRLHPTQIATGFGEYAENCRFTDGCAASRPGARIMPWAARWHPTLGPQYIASGTPYAQPYTNVIGAGTFNDPVSSDYWLIIVTRDPGTGIMSAYRAQPGNTAIQIGSPDGAIVPERVKLIQTYDGLVLLRGKDYDPLYMRSISDGFVILPEATAPKVKIPPSSHGIYWQNRLFLVDARDAIAYRDSVWVSDIGGVDSVLQGEAAWNNFKINVGSSDRLVAVYKFNANTLICAKSGSIRYVTNITGDNQSIQDNAEQDAITTEYGCLAPDSFVQVGADLWFLAHRRGIVSIAQTTQGILQSVDVPKSLDVQKLVDRINWEYADKAVAAFHDNRVHFAVPIDGSTINNAVLVYDTATKAWAGMDTGAAIEVSDWFKYTYAGAERLHFLHPDGYVYMHEDGIHDHVGANGLITYTPVIMTFRTRGYGSKAGLRRGKHERMACGIKTLDPEYSVTAVFPGQAERQSLITNRTTDRTKWIRPHGRPAWEEDNSNDDYLDPYREDYSLSVPAGGILIGSGIDPDVHQESVVERRIHAKAESVQFEFTNNSGRLEVARAGIPASKVPPSESTTTKN